MPEAARKLELVAQRPRPSSILPLEANGLVFEAAGARLIDSGFSSHSDSRPSCQALSAAELRGYS